MLSRGSVNSGVCPDVRSFVVVSLSAFAFLGGSVTSLTCGAMVLV